MPLSEPLRQGSVKQHGRRPLRGAVQRLPLHFKSPKAQVRRFRRSSWTQRASFKLYHRRASARLAVSSLSSVVWSLIGCPSSKNDRSMLLPVGKFQGAKPGRSGAQRYERQEAPVAPGIAWPPVCNPASRPDTSMLPIMWGGNNHPARARVGSSPRDGGGRARGTNTLRLLSKCCGRRLPVRLAFIFRDAVQVRNQPKRGFAFAPRRLNGQTPITNLLGRGIEPRASTASQRPSVGLGKAWSIQVRGVFHRPAALHAGIVHTLPKGGKKNEPRAPARPPETDGPSFCCESGYGPTPHSLSSLRNRH